METCKSPLKRDCSGTDIKLYIQVGEERLPICSKCWEKLADSDAEWDEKGFRRG
ncbi:MAG: hypothetical protein NWF09_09075 [Candidatus Bathyarchaeota archaeon]|nr:hypothetical protein [Candidatus Bathyarchaeota archaeon]